MVWDHERSGRKTVALVLCILALFSGGTTLVWNHIQVSRDNNLNINPAVFEAFRKIEETVGDRFSALVDAGKLDPEKWMTKRELWVHYESQRCMAYGMDWPETFCDAGKYYNSLTELEYKLPTFYKPGYTPRTPYWMFWGQ